jgi:hypothetical protein
MDSGDEESCAAMDRRSSTGSLRSPTGGRLGGVSGAGVGVGVGIGVGPGDDEDLWR